MSIGAGRATITTRQREVLDLVAGGHGNKAIAERIGKSESDVKAVVSRLLTSLHAANRAELAQFAVRLELIGESDLAPHEIRELLRRSPVMIGLVRGPEHRLVFVNDEAQKLVGNIELIGRLIKEVFRAWPAIGERLDRVYTTGEIESSRGAVDIPGSPWRPARTTDVAYTCAPVRDETGTTTGVVIYAIDLTNATRRGP